MRISASIRKDLFGGVILFVLINLTLFPYIWGGQSIADSLNTASLYAAGSAPQRTSNNLVPRNMDPGAAAWQLEPSLILERQLMLQKHEWPIWNQFNGYGTPLAANMQSQPYSPFAWVAILLPGPEGYNVFILVRIYVAGLFLFLFLRRFMELAPALLGGIAFMYTGYFWMYLTMPEMSVEVLIPALLLACELLLRSPGRRTIAFFAVAFAASVLGGMPESLFLSVVFATLYFFVRLFTTPSLRANARTIVGSFIGGALLSGMLSAVLLGPFAEYAPRSFNMHATLSPGLTADDFSLDSAMLYLAPLLHGPIWNNIFQGSDGFSGVRGFFGTSTVVLALVGIVSSARSAYARIANDGLPWQFFLATASVLLAKRYGFPLVEWIGALPGFRLILLLKYEEAVLGCCIAVLAAIGIDRLLKGFASTVDVCESLLLVVMVESVDAGLMRPAYRALADHGEYFIDALASSLAIVAIMAAIFVALKNEWLSNGVAATVVLTLAAVEANVSYVVPMYYFVTSPTPSTRSAFEHGAPYITFLQSHIGTGRFYGEDDLLFPNWSAPFGIRDPRDLDALYDGRYLPFVQTFFTRHVEEELDNRFAGIVPTAFEDPLQRRFLTLSSVRYVGATHSIASAFLREEYHDRAMTLYRYVSPLPRLSVFERAIPVSDGPASLATLKRPDFDPLREVIVEEPVVGAVRGSRKADSATAGELTTDDADHVVGNVRLPKSSIVMLNDTWFPGWNAYVDDAQVPMLHADYLFRGIAVAAGKHRIEFRYSPPVFLAGRIVSLIGLAVLFAMLAFDVFATARSKTARARLDFRAREPA